MTNRQMNTCMSLSKSRDKETQQSFPDPIDFELFYLMVAFCFEMWLCTNTSHQSARRIANNKHTVIFIFVSPGGLQQKEKFIGGRPAPPHNRRFTKGVEGFL